MSDNPRFGGLKKISDLPAAELLARAGMELQTEVSAPIGASVPEVLAELETKGPEAIADMVLLLALALPVREAVWWGCLCMRELLGEGAKPWPTLKAAEDWVFQPGDKTRKAAMEAAEKAGDEPSELCAAAVGFCDGKLGPYEMQAYDAPPAATAKSIFGAVLTALGDIADREADVAEAEEEKREAEAEAREAEREARMEAREAEREARLEAALEADEDIEDEDDEEEDEDADEAPEPEPVDIFKQVGDRVVDRALDIARGGNGKIEIMA